MSTSCRIGIKVGDKVESIYCHWDGYPRGEHSVGQILKKHYNDEKKILKLMELGDLSSLGSEPIEDPNGWDIGRLSLGSDTSFHNPCITYRSRGDDGVDKCVHESEAEYIEYASHSYINYAYLYKDGLWKILSSGNKPLFKAL